VTTITYGRSHKDVRGRITTAVLELGQDGNVYLRENGNYQDIKRSKKAVVNATDSELVDMLRPWLGLPHQFYKNGENHRR